MVGAKEVFNEGAIGQVSKQRKVTLSSELVNRDCEAT
jgi:hypothetical protein